ncbi:MAG: YkvA family protein [Candidatus Methylomirabilia bacterium]
MRELLLLLPNLARLVLGVAGDPRVPLATKVTLAAAAAYVVSPVDLLPDFIPFVGYLDDVLVVAVVLDGLLNHVDRGLLLHHWPGDPTTLEKAAAVAHGVAAWVPGGVKARIFGARNLA